MIDRETLAASFVSAQMIAAPNWARANCNPGTHEQFLDDAFKVADAFLAYAAKQREKAAGECKHEWRQPPYMSDHICHKCGAPKVKPEPPKPCNHLWVTDGGECYFCLFCNVPKVKVDKAKPEPPKPERVAREVWVCFNSDGTPMYAWGTQDREGTRKLFREVLPEEGK